MSLLHSLVPEANHDVLVISDSDMRVTPDYLNRVVAPMVDKKVGLVTCLYRGEDPDTLAARLEALYIGVTFLPSVLVARRFLNMRFALGATIALRREDLARLGGFAALGDYLADDYQLGRRTADLSLRVNLSDYIVANVLGATTFREQWDRELHWAHCSRVSRPLEYPGLILTFTTPLAVILTLFSGLAPVARLSLAVSMLLRWLVAWLVTGYTDNRTLRRWLLWLPVRDMLSALIWCIGVVGRRVVWRDETFALQPGGRLEPFPSSGGRGVESPRLTIVHRAVRGMDALLRRHLHIYEFCQDGDCLLRLAIRENDRDVTLADGTHVERGALVGELHMWNEHIPAIPSEGPDLAWALTFRRRLSHSLQALAVHVESGPQLQRVRAFRADLSFGSRYGLDQWVGMLERWGFELVGQESSYGLWARLVDWGDNLYARVLTWAFNPASLRGERRRGWSRDQLWMSREVLTRKYGAQKAR